MMRPVSIALMPIALSVAIAVGAGPASAGKYDTGASDTTIKIGQTYP
jgi:hypothetical protein